MWFLKRHNFHSSFTIGLFLLVGMEATGAHRVATLSPLATELLYQLGKSHEIVAGIGSPTVPLTFPSPGEWFSPSLERLVHTKVTQVISNQGAISPLLQHGLATARIPTFVFDIRKPQDLGDEVRRLYREVYHELPPSWLSPWEACVQRQLKAQKTFTFVGFVWGDPPILLGRNVFLSRLIEALGGKNLLPDRITLDYPQASKEWLMAQRPDVVFVFDEFLKLTSIEKLKNNFWPDFQPQLKVLPADHFGRSTFSVFDHLAEIAAVPEEPCARP